MWLLLVHYLHATFVALWLCGSTFMYGKNINEGRSLMKLLLMSKLSAINCYWFLAMCLIILGRASHNDLVSQKKKKYNVYIHQINLYLDSRCHFGFYLKLGPFIVYSHLYWPQIYTSATHLPMLFL